MFTPGVKMLMVETPGQCAHNNIKKRQSDRNSLISDVFIVTFAYIHLAGIYFFKSNKGNTRIICEICSKLIIKTSERGQWRRSDVFIVNFE